MKHDEDFSQMLEMLDEDFQMEMLEQLNPKMSDQSSDSAIIRRIEIKTFTKLGLREPAVKRLHANKRRFRWKIATIFTASVLICAGVIAAVPGPVSAALQKWIEFIPGIGTVQQSDGQSNVAVLNRPVRADSPNGFVTVMGVMMTSTQIDVRVNGPGAVMPNNVSFKTENGQTIHLDAGGVATGSQWSGNYIAYGKFGAVPTQETGTIILGSGWNTQIPVQLKLAKSVADMSKLGPTDVHQGVSITAIAQREAQKVQLTLVPQYHGPYHIWDLAPNVVSSDLGIHIQDASGKTYKVNQVLGEGPNSQFTFSPTKGVQDYTVTIPRVDATYQGSARVTLPIPKTGSIAIDKTVNLGGFPIHFIKAERVSDNGSSAGIRYYVDMHASLTDAKELHGFQTGTSYSAELNKQTGVFEWIMIDAKPNQRNMTLHLTEPQVYISGPWKFHIRIQ